MHKGFWHTGAGPVLVAGFRQASLRSAALNVDAMQIGLQEHQGCKSISKVLGSVMEAQYIVTGSLTSTRLGPVPQSFVTSALVGRMRRSAQEFTNEGRSGT